jgi:Fic family protein
MKRKNCNASNDLLQKSKLVTTLLPSDEDLLQMNVEEFIDSHLRDVKDGRHADLKIRAEALEKLKEKHIAAADRNRKSQIKNINQLYEYEVENAHTLYQVVNEHFFQDVYLLYCRKLILTCKKK